jgi:hypothetical protein
MITLHDRMTPLGEFSGRQRRIGLETPWVRRAAG